MLELEVTVNIGFPSDSPCRETDMLFGKLHQPRQAESPCGEVLPSDVH